MHRHFTGFLKDYRFRFFLAIVLATATLLAGIGLMASSGYLISKAALRPMIVDLFVVTAAVRFFGISRAVLRYFERVVAHDLTFRILLSIRIWFYNRISERPMMWLMGRRPGDLLANVVADIETLQNAYLRVIAPAIVAILVSIITCGLLWFFDPIIALSTLIFLAINGFLYSWMVQKISKGRGIMEVEAKAQLKTSLVDNLNGLAEVLWLGKSEATLKEFSSLQNKLDTIQKKHAKVSGLNEGMNHFAAHLGMFASLMLMIPLVLSGDLEGPMLALVAFGVLSSFEAVQTLAGAMQYKEKTKAAFSRLVALDQSVHPIGTSVLLDLPASYDLNFENVRFAYREEQILLQDITLNISEGSKTAIVGPSGSGKSTLVNLLLRLWEPDSGEITLGGTAISMYPVDQLRLQFAVAAQDSYIFSRSIRENLEIGNPSASLDECDRVLTRVGLEDFTSGNTNHLDARRAVRLSGGEKQALTLARAMLNDDARIWIFDEPSANLDRTTEREIMNGIWSNLGHRSLIMITHRLVNMDKMDQIIVMDKGKVVEKGTHAELLAADNFYAKMFEQQNLLLK
ncbi:MAG TPA: thiol reductant ABC exporter subunit CydC [Bacteroidales bacterium]|nr:thiol reductant ABC exporter subunit CydC [Bacteroidales bacterium]